MNEIESLLGLAQESPKAIPREKWAEIAQHYKAKAQECQRKIDELSQGLSRKTEIDGITLSNLINGIGLPTFTNPETGVVTPVYTDAQREALQTHRTRQNLKAERLQHLSAALDASARSDNVQNKLERIDAELNNSIKEASRIAYESAAELLTCKESGHTHHFLDERYGPGSLARLSAVNITGDVEVFV